MTSIVRPFQSKPGGRTRGITATSEYELNAYDHRRRIGDELRTLRLSIGLTQKQVGDACGVEHTLVSDWENGRKLPSPNHYDSLQKLFEVSNQVLGRFLLRYTNPYIHAMLYDQPADKVTADLDYCPERIVRRGNA